MPPPIMTTCVFLFCLSIVGLASQVKLLYDYFLLIVFFLGIFPIFLACHENRLLAVLEQHFLEGFGFQDFLEGVFQLFDDGWIHVGRSSNSERRVDRLELWINGI